MATATLNETQCAYVRQLLFEELHEAAEALVEQAADAAHGGSAACDNIAGDDALSTWRSRLLVTADLLDTIGWSVAKDTAMIVELERKRREA
jgi:hypothetical protein